MGLRYLVLDTSGPRAVCALTGDDGALRAVRAWDATGGRSELITVELERLLRDGAVQLSRLRGVVVCVGPGSFTGVRAAVATAKALSLAPGLPVVGVDALAALAGAAPPGARVALLDAHRDELFAAAYAADGAAVAAPSLVPRPALGQLLGARDGARVVAAPALLTALGVEGASPSDDERTAALARLGAARLDAGDADDAAALEPLYVRPPDLSLPRARTRA